MEEKRCLSCGNGNVVQIRHYKNWGVPQRIIQDDVTLQSHSLISRKRSRVGIGRQERREKGKKRHDNRRGQNGQRSKRKRREDSEMNQCNCNTLLLSMVICF